MEYDSVLTELAFLKKITSMAFQSNNHCFPSKSAHYDMIVTPFTKPNCFTIICHQEEAI
jgi:hypothetical protein